jgi:hypothetical protein
MAYHASNELEGLIAIIRFCCRQRTIEDFASQPRCRGRLKRRHEIARRCKPLATFVVAADIGRLQGEVDPPSGGIRLIGRHNLLAEQKTGMCGQFDA